MSKIYEALLRAEIDRISANGTSPEQEPEVRADKPLTTWTKQTLEPQPPAPLQPNPAFETGGHADTSAVASPFEPIARVALPGVATRWQPDLRALLALNQRGAEVEQIRGLRTRVHELRHYTPELKVIQISSAISGEGKSFVAMNLALSLANYKRSPVLLIDGDMRRGTLHKLLGAPSAPGLTEYLAGTSDLASILQVPSPDVTRRPDMQGLNSLSFIPAGRDAENASDLAGNGNFAQLLAEARDAFDWIIVDSSPVTLVSDGVNLARVCDGVLLVTRAGFTRFEVAQRTVAELRAANVLGVVLNAVTDVKPNGAYYGY